MTIQNQAVEVTGSHFDYTHQAWTLGGRYVRCGHPKEMECGCYGRAHEGQRARLEDLPTATEDEDGGRTRIGNTPTCEDCDQPQDHCTCGDEEAASPRADEDVPPDPEGMNDRRASEAEEVLNQFESAFGEAPYGGISQEQLADLREQNLADLLCDFGHFCDRNGVDMQAVIRRAKMHYDEETANEGVQFTRSN